MRSMMAALVVRVAFGVVAVPLQTDPSHQAAEVLFSSATTELLAELGVDTIEHACTYIDSVGRDLHFLELFAGCQRMTDSFSKRVPQVLAVDI